MLVRHKSSSAELNTTEFPSLPGIMTCLHATLVYCCSDDHLRDSADSHDLDNRVRVLLLILIRFVAPSSHQIPDGCSLVVLDFFNSGSETSSSNSLFESLHDTA
uniref:Uncharacterized protein n=1 Tax=Guillardia theta TaxID=55529 RepID=A0A6U6BUR3_GUITH|mmetsp:Transcript_421/g.925  ORF Transcript_421/g.925 Transcript_421/m.925 type:complete len:104 (+) Transcript_421:521-832(+)